MLRFLTQYGYVNTGFVANMPRPLPFTSGVKPETVLVVGAGTAGLAAAYHLRNFGYQVLAQTSHEFKNGRFVCDVGEDFGGQWSYWGSRAG